MCVCLSLFLGTKNKSPFFFCFFKTSTDSARLPNQRPRRDDWKPIKHSSRHSGYTIVASFFFLIILRNRREERLGLTIYLTISKVLIRAHAELLFSLLSEDHITLFFFFSSISLPRIYIYSSIRVRIDIYRLYEEETSTNQKVFVRLICSLSSTRLLFFSFFFLSFFLFLLPSDVITRRAKTGHWRLHPKPKKKPNTNTKLLTTGEVYRAHRLQLQQLGIIHKRNRKRERIQTRHFVSLQVTANGFSASNSLSISSLSLSEIKTHILSHKKKEPLILNYNTRWRVETRTVKFRSQWTGRKRRHQTGRREG